MESTSLLQLSGLGESDGSLLATNIRASLTSSTASPSVSSSALGVLEGHHAREPDPRLEDKAPSILVSLRRDRIHQLSIARGARGVNEGGMLPGPLAGAVGRLKEQAARRRAEKKASVIGSSLEADSKGKGSRTGPRTSDEKKRKPVGNDSEFDPPVPSLSKRAKMSKQEKAIAFSSSFSEGTTATESKKSSPDVTYGGRIRFKFTKDHQSFVRLLKAEGISKSECLARCLEKYPGMKHVNNPMHKIEQYWV